MTDNNANDNYGLDDLPLCYADTLRAWERVERASGTSDEDIQRGMRFGIDLWLSAHPVAVALDPGSDDSDFADDPDDELARALRCCYYFDHDQVLIPDAVRPPEL